jgi:uncharacterized iron-regulated protein
VGATGALLGSWLLEQRGAVSTLRSQVILDKLSQAQIIYLGERHSNPDDHRAQLIIIKALYRRNPQLAIAFEMFQRPYQGVLNEYGQGLIEESELRQSSEYDERWGYDWEFYAPILRFAQAKQLPLIALNTPTEITRKVARQGLSSLDESDRQWIPPLSEIKTDDPAYRAYLLPFFESHGGQGHSRGFERFVEAQVLWDETMAEAIAQFVRRHPQRQVIVLVGQGHILYGYGIPSRVRRRLEEIQQRSLIFEAVAEQGDRLAADYVWITRKYDRLH